MLFAIRGSSKKRIITAAIFTLFILVTLFGAFVLKSIYTSIMGVSALILAFWPLTDAFDRIVVTNIRIKYSNFSKMTARTEDIPLDRLASCTEEVDSSKIKLLFLIDDSKELHSIRYLLFDKADENAVMLKQLPCPKQDDLRQILAKNYK